MPKQLKIFIWKVVALLIIAALVAALFIVGNQTRGTQITYAFPDYTKLPAFTFGNKVLNRLSEVDSKGEEVYKEYKLVEENSNYELYFNEAELDIALVHKGSGEIWFSNPNAETIKLSSGMATRMKSQITLRSVDKTSEAVANKNSFSDCLAYQIERDENNLDEGKDTMKQYYITVNEKGGLRVVYIIGKVPLKYNFPVLVPEARFNELLDIINQQIGMAAKMVLNSNYKLVNSSTWSDNTVITKDQREKIMSNVPNVEQLLSSDMGGFYALQSDSIWQNRLLLGNVEKYFTEAGISSEEIDEYDDLAGFISDNSNLFMVPLDYFLEDDGLKVSIKSEDIEYDDSRYDITSISVMEYFGSADSSEEGYIVVPDGSGALINFNNGKVQLSSEMSIQLYGIDRGKNIKEAPAMVEQGYLPVWGLKKENSSLFCIIENSASVATIKADINRGSRSASNKAWPEFQLVASDEVSFLGVGKTLQSYQDRPIVDNIEIKYSILPASEGHEYSDMARYYREYLLREGQLKEQTAKENINFNLELEGAIDAFDTVFGVEYQYINALTSYNQAQEILSKLTDGGVSNISVRYRGWANNGLYNRYWNRLRLLSEMGSKDELKQLMSFAKEKDIDIYYDAELILVSGGEDKLMDGFFKYTDAAREISRDNARYRQFSLMMTDNWFGSSYIVKPSKVSSAAKTLLKDFQDMGINTICLGRMGKVLTGDYNVNDLTDRNQVQQVYADVNKSFADAGFKVANVGANSYMLNGTAVLFELPNTSSMHYMADEAIPFYQMVVHGLVSYSGEAINQSGNPQRSLLNAVEYGAGLFYRWMYADDIEMYDNYYEDMYALNYTSWLDNALESYKRYNEELGHVSQLRMTKHSRINEELSLTEYEDGTRVYVNYGKTEANVDGVSVPANDYFVVRKGA